MAAAVGVIAVGALSWGANEFWLNPSYATGIGEQRVVRLSDGSRITLNSNSEVRVSYRRSERGISIDRGEALFEVTKDATRPFRVRAGGHQVEALGTSFVVRREAQELTVTLVEGKVEVSPLFEAPPQRSESSETHEERVTLSPGQRLRLAGDNVLPKIDAPRMDAIIAWRRGEVVLDGTPLNDAVAELNRYDQRRLVIADPQIAEMKISGIYHTGDSAVFAEMVSRLYGLEVSQSEGEIQLRAMPRSEAIGE